MSVHRLCWALLMWLLAAVTQAAELCGPEAQPGAADAQYFMVLAGQNEIFYDHSGPAFVMLLESHPALVEIGAFGIFAQNGQPRFGAVPAASYETFLHEPTHSDAVMLRLQISEPQYQRVLTVLRTWERRVREGALLYPDIALDNILLAKQATEVLNLCSPSIKLYTLDWGLEDDISEHNAPRRIPFEYFKTLRELNVERHVTDAAMPAPLLSLAATAVNAAASITKQE